MAGAYLLFTLVITALAATSAGLAFGLSAVELAMSSFRLALFGGALTAILVLYEMLTRDGVVKTAVTGVFVTILSSSFSWTWHFEQCGIARRGGAGRLARSFSRSAALKFALFLR